MKEPKYQGRLKESIANAGMNQRQFAEKVGVCPSFVSRVVNGKWLLDSLRQSVWSAYLGKKRGEIFGD